jgi:hypothetical protein
MADTITTIYEFTLPEVGASDDTWGTKLNANWAKMETLLAETFDGGSDTDFGTIKSTAIPTDIEHNLALKFAGAKNIQFKDAAGVQEGAWGIDGAGGNVFMQKQAAGGATTVSRIRLEADGAINAHVGFFKGSGAGLNSVPLSALDFSTPVPAIFSSLETRNASTSGLKMSDAAGAERGYLYSNTSGLVLRYRPSGVTLGQMFFTPAGEIFWTGDHQGISFGSEVASDNAVLTRHLDLYGGTYGANVTGGRLNLVYPASSFVDFVCNNVVVAQVDNANDTSVPSATTLITMTKGDARYRNASNLNAGTVPAARLPTDAAAEDWVAARIAARTVNEVGSDALLRLSPDSNGANPNATEPGSSLSYAAASDHNTGTHPSGTWRCMGYIPTSGGDSGQKTSLWRRIS